MPETAEPSEELWRAGGSWRPPVRSRRWPPFVGAMAPCGAGAFALGHLERGFVLPLEIASFAVVLIACAAPIVATHYADEWIRTLDEGLAAPPRALAARCIALAAGALAMAYLPAAVPYACAGAAAYETGALGQAWRIARRGSGG